ncbi:hypothetical protein LPB136_03805 [Tenacibaculum todarodis]|uniref:Uncharacterized protein n=1 Tax=Tenacibaculum todarodis TaxID=1850252 RepID=A0A1L3JHC9_9FLAO|nr:hypothetical protein [Tenacibaculum todarodis]APG64541.1 hypothetical protein LPB136_03805 [Tenacibaculum todarodis]
MINLKEVLSTFTEDKQQELLSYLDKKNKRKDAKNIQLVKLLLSDRLSSTEISDKLYGKQNKAALHALRKRLFQSLIDFTANLSIKEENSIDMKLIKYILSARNFLLKGQIKVGYQILDKAIIIANEYQLFTILNEVYHTKIQFAHLNKDLNLEEIISLFKQNQQQLLLEENLNIAYAQIRKNLVEYQQNKSKLDIKQLIEKVLVNHNIIISDSLSFKSLYQIIQITSISSAQKFDYHNIESFIIETYQIIKNHVSKDKQINYHLEVLYLISNVFFRNKKFNESQKYLKLMLFYMNEDNKKYFKDYKPKYDLLLALNLNYTKNQGKAIALLESYVDKKNIDLVAQLDFYLSLIVFYYQHKSLDKARKLLSKFYHTDKWYIEKAGIVWTIKKNLIEILLQIDLGNIDLVDSRLKSFKRNYFSNLTEINQERVITYLKLVEIYYKNPDIATSKDFHAKVETSFNWIDTNKEDIFMMSFFAWLKAKMTKQDVYLVTLNLINN